MSMLGVKPVFRKRFEYMPGAKNRVRPVRLVDGVWMRLRLEGKSRKREGAILGGKHPVHVVCTLDARADFVRSAEIEVCSLD